MYCQKVLIAIYEKRARLTPHVVDLENVDSREEYINLSPLGKIPLIVLNHGPLIPESNIIIEYLENLGSPYLISKNPDVARKTRFKDKFIDLYLTESIQCLLREGSKSEAEQDARQIEDGRRRITVVYDFLEHELKGQEWANGEEFSMSDCSAAAALLNAPEVMPYTGYQNIVAYAERLAERESIRRVWQDAAQYQLN